MFCTCFCLTPTGGPVLVFPCRWGLQGKEPASCLGRGLPESNCHYLCCLCSLHAAFSLCGSPDCASASATEMLWPMGTLQCIGQPQGNCHHFPFLLLAFQGWVSYPRFSGAQAEFNASQVCDLGPWMMILALSQHCHCPRRMRRLPDLPLHLLSSPFRPFAQLKVLLSF